VEIVVLSAVRLSSLKFHYFFISSILNLQFTLLDHTTAQNSYLSRILDNIVGA